MMFVVLVPAAFAVDMRVTGSGGVNFREEASTDSRVIRSVDSGTVVNVVEHNPAGWSQVNMSGTVGYIKSEFLTIPAGAQNTYFRTTDGVNFRSAPSTDASVISSVSRGTDVEMIEHDPAGWSKVRLNGVVGYIRSDFLALPSQIPQQTTAPAASSSESSSVLKTVDTVNLRSGPSTEHSVVTVLAINTTVSVVEPSANGWTKVSANGRVGFIRSDLLSASGNHVELLDWSVVINLIRNGDPIRCYDVRTGLTFYVKCFSKGDHADVEPITQEDTDTILRTHNGVWSWSARPLWVTIGDRTVAASMHGMPHDISTNPNNGMNGHLCMHFLGSTTSSTSATYRADLQNAVQEAWDAR